jgi:hypothetical protein
MICTFTRNETAKEVNVTGDSQREREGLGQKGYFVGFAERMN